MSEKFKVGKVFYIAYTGCGIINKIEIIGINDDGWRVEVLQDDTVKKWTTKERLEEIEYYSSREEAQKAIDDEIKHIEEKVEAGKVFYRAYTGCGSVVKTEVMSIDDNGWRVNLLLDDTEECWTTRGELERVEHYSSREEAQKVIDEKIKHIKEEFSTPEKMLNYVYNRTIEPFYNLSYHDIVADVGLTTLEMKIFENKCKEFFGVTLNKKQE